VVIVTAHRTDGYADFRARGFAAVLGKPFDLDQLYETVRRVLCVER
jgi:DNA-binding NtrC family response regulator